MLLREPHCLSTAQPTRVYLMALPRHFLKDKDMKIEFKVTSKMSLACFLPTKFP